MKHLFNLNQLSMKWRGKKKSQNAEGMWECYGAETVTTSESAYIQHTLSIHSAYIGTSREAAGKKVKSTMGLLRYAAMLMMLLTLGVGQMWAWQAHGTFNSWAGATMTQSSANAAVYYYSVSGTNIEFKITGDKGWGDNEKGNTYIDNNYGNINLSNSSGNIKGGVSGTWYICYHTTDDKVYATTTNPNYPDMVIAGNNFGSIGSWSTTATVMTGNGSGTYTKTITNVGTSSCEFKIVYKGTWTGAKGYDSKKVTGTNCSSGPSDASGNISFTPAVAGSVTITYVQSTGAITIACPKFSVTYDGNGKTSGSVPTDASSPYNSGSTVTVKGNTGSLAKTGCVFDGWMTAQDGSGTTYAPGATFSITGPTTLYARWISKTIYVYDNLSWGAMKVYTFESNRNGSWSGTAATSLGSGWYRVDLLDGAGKFILNNGSGTQTEDITIASYSPTIADGHSYEVYDNSGTKKIREKKLAVSFDMKSHGSAVSSQNIYYNGLVTEPSPAPSATGYTFGGWYKETGCTNAWNFGSDRITAARTLYAKWTENMSSVSLVASPSGKGSFTIGGAAATSTTAGVTTTRSVTAVPISGYHFVSWAISGDASISSTTTNPTTVTGGGAGTTATLTATFEADDVYTLTVAAGTGISAVTGTTNNISAAQNIAITATVATGYTWSTWTKTGAGTLSTFTAGTKNQTVTVGTAGDITLTASATENMSTLTTSNHYDAGDPEYDNPEATVSSIGITTTATLTAETPGTGYTFTGWTLSSNLVVTSGDKDSDLSITVRTNGNGAAATAQANYVEVLTQDTWIVAGGNKIVTSGTTWRTTADANNSMVKKTGHSAESVVYFTVPVTSVCSGDNNGNFQFKIYNTSTDTWYSLAAGGDSYYLLKAEDGTEKTLSTSGKNIELRAYVTGDYEFKLDYSSTPKLTVTWPIFNQVRISSASPTDATNTGNFDLSDPVSNVRTVTRSLNANTTYTFKIMYESDWFGKNSGAFTRNSSTSSNSETISTSGGDMTLTTDYAGDYTFKFNESTKALSVDFPTAYTITYGAGTINGSSTDISVSPSFTSGAYVLPETDVTFSKGSTNTGYTWKGWYSNEGGTGDAWSTTDANLSLTATRSGNISVYACYNLVNYTITYNLNGGSNPGGAPTGFTIESSDVTLPTPTKTGYTFNGWYDNSSFTGSAVTKIASGSYGNKEYWAKWTAKNYTITLHEQGATTHGSPSDGGTISVTYDANTNLSKITAAPEKTGYTFDGYYDTEECDGTWIIKDDTYFNWDGTYLNSTTGAWQYDGNVDLYAKWVANKYTITFDKQTSAEGYYSGGSWDASKSVYYDGDVPSISGTIPTAANGYKFVGFYTEEDGGGEKIINADKSWIASVSGYTDENTKWVRANDATLYAYYQKAEITELTVTPAVVATEGTVAVTPTIDPMPEGTTEICWELQYSNGTPLPSQPIFSQGPDNSVIFQAPAASATYRIQATLRKGSTCDAGDVLSTEAQTFQVAGEHTVTVQYQDGDGRTLKDTIHIVGLPLEWSDEITAPEIFGYTFTSWTAGDGVTLTDDGGASTETESDQNTIQIKAVYDGTLTANYSQNAIIYFKNTLGWSDVYVNFYPDSYWNNPKGSGNQGVTNRNKHMTRIDDTDIWYYDYGAASISPSLYVSFTSASQDGYENFWLSGGVNVVYPANYQDDIHTNNSSETGFKAATPMFIPLASQDKVTLNSSDGGKADYYNAGYWTKYTPGTGYTLEIYNEAGNVMLKSVEFTSEDELMPMKAVVDLEAGHTYKYQLRRGGESSAGIYYGNSGTMTYNDHGQGTPWAMTNSPLSMCGITTNAAGDYTFHLSYSANASSQYRLRMAVDYPIASGDYCVIYKDNVDTRGKASAIVTKVNNGKDTVSFFIRPGSSPVMKIMQASVNASTGAITWTSYYVVPSDMLTSLSGNQVYNVCIAMNGTGGISSVEKIEPYTGNYYIRTDCAGTTKWDNYKALDHQMTYSDYAKDNSGFTHYFVHWVTSGSNVKFCIANDYSPCISDTLCEDIGTVIADITEEGEDYAGKLNSANANIRFMWDQRDNSISRAYIGGSGIITDRFLVLEGDAKMYDEYGHALTGDYQDHDQYNNYLGTDDQVIMHDDQNFLYERIIKVNTSARAKLTAKYNNNVQYFKGSEGAFAEGTTVELLGGDAGGKHKMRIVYDFKTNRLVTAYLPEGEIDTDLAINADLMLVREHQEEGQQITFNGGSLTDVHTVYGVMRFNRWTLNNKEKTGAHGPVGDPKSVYERSLYWISFPFDVNLSDVFGFGTYGEDWIIEYYDGESRAANGYWIDSPSFWRFVMPAQRPSFTLEAGKGYVLALEIANMKDNNDDFWSNNIEQVELFFPSAENVGGIEATDVTTSVHEHACTIDRTGNDGPDINKNRTRADSHWNMIGVPSYANYGESLTSDGSTVITWNSAPYTNDLPFLYEWNMVDDSYTVQSGTTYPFKSMHSYMVQYHGDLHWALASASPVSAPRFTPDELRDREFRLELQQNDIRADQTFVKLSNNENVSADFVFDEDLSKEFNKKKANIYTLIDYIPAAGNVLPLSTSQKTIVPVGVQIKTDGEYTFAMPDGTDGIGVTLIDNETGEHTNLGLTDYTVNLNAGTINERFVLEISPISQTTTDIETVTGNGVQVTGVRKVMIDGILYIVRDGQVFDARGARVQ